MAKKKDAAPKKAGGRRKAQKETKAETVDVSEGVQLLLGNMMQQKDREYYVTTYLGLKAKKDKAAQNLSDFEKKAKEAGVDMKALKNVLNMEKMDPLDLATLLKQTAAFMADRGLPLQLQLYEPKYGSVEEQAQKMGWDAGVNGRSPELHMWPEKSPGHEAYMRGWNSGQRQIVENNQAQH